LWNLPAKEAAPQVCPIDLFGIIFEKLKTQFRPAALCFHLVSSILPRSPGTLKITNNEDNFGGFLGPNATVKKLSSLWPPTDLSGRKFAFS